MLQLLHHLNRALSHLMAPFGHDAYWFDLCFWPTITALFALWVYKVASNQRGIEAAKNLIKAHLLEIRIYRDQPSTVLAATGHIAVQNAKYLAFNLAPMLIMAAPMLLVLIQLESQFAFAPIEPGTKALLVVDMADGALPTDVQLALPSGVSLDAPPVRTTDGQVFWRLQLNDSGDHTLTLTAGGTQIHKVLSVGGQARPVSGFRTQSWLGVLYPNEAPLASDSPIAAVSFSHPASELGWIPDGEGGIVLWFLGLSLLVGFGMKDVFGVSL